MYADFLYAHARIWKFAVSQHADCTASGDKIEYIVRDTDE